MSPSNMEAAQMLLQYFVLPIWFAAGLADWICHRRSDIQHTAGPKESIIHLLMFGELAIPLLAALFLEINAAIFALMIAAFLLHQATALWDVSYAVSRRNVSPVEQQIHSVLEMMPLTAGLLVALMHWPQFLALFGAGNEPARFDLALKSAPLPVSQIILVLAGAVLLEAGPYLEELWRTARAAHANGRAELKRRLPS